MIIAIIGSRDYPDSEFVDSFVTNLCAQYVKANASLEIVSGGARGPDTIGVNRAKKFGLKTRVFKAEWNKWGRANAGKIRNADIVNYAEAMIAFIHRESEGTMHAIGLAERKGIPILKVYSHSQMEHVC